MKTLSIGVLLMKTHSTGRTQKKQRMISLMLKTIVLETFSPAYHLHLEIGMRLIQLIHRVLLTHCVCRDSPW